MNFYDIEIDSFADVLAFFPIANELKNIKGTKIRNDLLSRAAKAKNDHDFDSDLLYELWVNRTKSVASLKSNNIKIAEFPVCKKHLKKITSLIASDDSIEAYNAAIKKMLYLKESGKCKDHYRAVIARMFFIFHPENHIDWVTDSKMKQVVNLFSGFSDFNGVKGNWYEQSKNISNYINKINENSSNPLSSGELNTLLGFFIKHSIEDVDSVANDSKKPAETTKLQQIKSRIGQAYFRGQLDKKFKACCITGIKNASLLRASHIKPWSDSNDEERLDVDNGLLLCANFDALFDSGLMSFDDNGNALYSPLISQEDRDVLGIDRYSKLLTKVSPKTLRYLAYHRTKKFRN